MSSKHRTRKSSPIALIRKIAKAIGVKVRFGRPMTEPNNCWCQFEGPRDCNHHFAMGWGRSYSEAAAKLLEELCRECWTKLPREDDHKKTNIYFQVFPTLDGYQVICAGTPIKVQQIK